MTSNWHIITGEYPPQQGGVSDYTELLAAGLAGEGHGVSIWCPECGGESPWREGVEVRRVRGGFSPAALFRLWGALSHEPGPRTLLVQYAPNALGLRGLNVFFCLWLLCRRFGSGDDVRVMFHEPFYYFARQPLRLNLLALAQRFMALLLLASSRVVYVSTTAWERLLRPLAWPRRLRSVWLPIPSTIPFIEDEGSVTRLRSELTTAADSSVIIGHFGTYGDHAVGTLSQVFTELLTARPDAVGLCLGGRSEEFVAAVLRSRPEFEGRLRATGHLSARDVSLHLQACDLVVQPYPDGVTSRRTSLMAALANGVAVVSNVGQLSEHVWDRSAGLMLSASPAADEIIRLAKELLGDPMRLGSLGPRARHFYLEHFHLAKTLAALKLCTEAVPEAEVACALEKA
jgi:glycosyltransferase involved in cell wall biosynthesis